MHARRFVPLRQRGLWLSRKAAIGMQQTFVICHNFSRHWTWRNA